MITLPGGKQIPSRKRCRYCGRVRSLKKFCLSTAGYYASDCNDCHPKRQAGWVKKNPKQYDVIQQRHLKKLKKLGVARIRDLNSKKRKRRLPVPNSNNVPATGARKENGNAS
jgi:hypothetical protein